MTRAIVLREHGGPDKLLWEEVPVGEPGEGEVRVRHTAIGVNFHDVYVRTGLYKSLPLPGIPGIEAAGVIEAVGPGVEHLVRGDRICYVNDAYGAYAQARLLPAALAVRLPDSITDDQAASIAVKGLTACMLLKHARPIRRGETVLVHAAAGGVGQPLVCWAKYLGARVIATAGSAEKAAVVRECGADEVILYRDVNFVTEVTRLTDGRGVDVVYDSVGADTFLGSLDCLALFGTLVNFGQSSGQVPPLLVSRLALRSNCVVRPVLFHYIKERRALEVMATGTFAMVGAGIIRPQLGLRIPLRDVAQAHVAIESRTTTGSVILNCSES
jgi:NADPH:quinone reductase